MRPAYLPAALSLRPARRPLFRRGGFRRRKRLFVRLFGAALPLAPGSPLRCGAPARARFAASAAALSLAPGSPLRCGALAPLGSPPSVSAALSLRSARRPLFRRGGFRRRKRLFVRPFGRRSRSRSVRRFGAALSLRSARRFGAFLRRPRPKVVKKIKKISDRYFIFS